MATEAQQALQWVNKLYEVLTKRRPNVEKYHKYFAGEQPLTYATQQWRDFHQDRYKDFSDNWCGVVARSPVDRLRIDGIRIGDDPAEMDPAERELWNDWQRNEMATQSKQGFLESTIAKRSAVLVWGDRTTDEPIATWEKPDQVVVAYDAANRRKRLASLKSWLDDDTEYATLYLPGFVWKFQRRQVVRVTDGRTDSGLYVAGATGLHAGWEPREVSGEPWPLPNPLGEVPVIEWENQPMLGGKPLSDIEGTIAMQDAINALWAYLFTAADYASMPARIVTGADMPKIPILDSQGQVIGTRPAKIEDLAQGRMLFLTGKDPKIDQWDAAKLDVFTGVIKEAIGHIASQTSTPGHYLLTNEKFANLNGDALTAAETPLAQKVGSEQLFYSPAARDTFRLFAKARGNDALAEQVRTAKILWKDAAMHSLSSVADAATKDASVGIPLAYILETRYGMAPKEIERVLAMRQAESTDMMLAGMGLPKPPGGSGAPVGG